MGGTFVLNGAGELTGVTQLNEWGLLETPILLTNTLAVGRIHDGCVQWMANRYPELGDTHDVVIPVVGECDDSFLNDPAARHARAEHCVQALEIAQGGPVREGSVGGGTGMVGFDFKAGVGTSSRKVPAETGHYTLGILVMTNFGRMSDLRLDGVAVGRMLEHDYPTYVRRKSNYGSIICVLATDAPLLSPQIHRLCKRAALGIGRAGSCAEHGSGEIVVGFSTANRIPRETRKMTTRVELLLDQVTGNLYEAAIEATEEAIHNALCAADEMIGYDGRMVPALPLMKVQALMARYRPGLPPAELVNAARGEDTALEPLSAADPSPAQQAELPLGTVDIRKLW
jgi:D-aminopeptidase